MFALITEKSKSLNGLLYEKNRWLFNRAYFFCSDYVQ